MRAAPPKLAVFLAMALCLAIAGCGCGGGEDSGESTASAQGEGQPPKSTQPLNTALKRSFPPPKPDPAVQGSAKAIERGEAACEGKSPKEVVKRFVAEATLTEDQRQALKQLKSAEAHPTPDFVAGQLAALVYERTLAGEVAAYGYQGCVYVLARGVAQSRR